ncbi:hypothetical protein PTKIN_Ptkin03bG0009700 [Pterospermum kingtungense]
MDQGHNKRIEQQIPASAWPRSSNVASSFTNMIRSNLPPLVPSPFRGFRKPYPMAHHAGAAAAGSSSSGTRTLLFQNPINPLFTKGASTTELIDQIPPVQNLSLLGSSADDSFVRPKAGTGAHLRWARNLDLTMDPKKIRRVMSNRFSAHKARVKKIEHTTDMEKQAESYEIQISVLNSKFAQESENKKFLEMESKELNQRIAACANHIFMVDAQIEEKRAEINRLRQVQSKQQQQKVQQDRTNWGANWDHGLTGQVMNPNYLNQPVYVNSNPVDAGLNTGDPNMLNQLYQNQPQQYLGQVAVPGWELGQGQMTNMMAEAGWETGGGQQTNVGLEQSGPGQLVQNLSLNQWQDQQQDDSDLSSALAELEQILNDNAENNNSLI